MRLSGMTLTMWHVNELAYVYDYAGMPLITNAMNYDASGSVTGAGSPLVPSSKGLVEILE